MSYVSVGDMAQLFQMRRHNAQLKTLSSQLSEELTTGVRQDTGAAVRGDFTALAGIDRSLASLASYKLATTEAAQLAGTQQVALDTLQTMLSDAGPSLLSASTSSSQTMISATTGDARQKFISAISALNTNTAGRYIFSGVASDTRPLPPAEDILAALTTEIAAETSATGIAAAVTAWFDAPPGGGGYLDVAYQGGGALAPVHIGAGETAELDATAADPQLRNALKGLAIAALVSQGALGADAVGRSALTRAAGEMVMSAESGLAALQALIGGTEAQIDDAATRNSAETSSLKIARSGMVAADPYDTASALQAVQTQIETLYTLTARLSRLSLTEYL
jgi:flagellar hook-associated protein 3 FlgL